MTGITTTVPPPPSPHALVVSGGSGTLVSFLLAQLALVPFLERCTPSSLPLYPHLTPAPPPSLPPSPLLMCLSSLFPPYGRLWRLPPPSMFFSCGNHPSPYHQATPRHWLQIGLISPVLGDPTPAVCPYESLWGHPYFWVLQGWRSSSLG